MLQDLANHLHLIDAIDKNTYSIGTLTTLQGRLSEHFKNEVGMKSGSCIVKTTRTMELIDITPLLTKEIPAAECSEALCMVYNPHTTAGLTINEGADPAVQSDIIAGFKQFVPMDFPFTHMEGNSPAHIMASLMGSSLTIAIRNGRFQLGTWQKIFFCEFDGPRTRKVHYHLLSSS